MNLEVAILDVKPGLEAEFESAFQTAYALIAGMPGYISHELDRCLKIPNRYVLLVRWEGLENYTVGFQQSAEYQACRRLLHHFYDLSPTVEHYERVFCNP